MIADLFVEIIWRLRWWVSFPPGKIYVFFCPASRAASNLGSLQFSIRDWDYSKLSSSHCHCLSTSCIPSFLECNTLLSQFRWGGRRGHQALSPSKALDLNLCAPRLVRLIEASQPLSKPSTWEKVTPKARLLGFHLPPDLGGKSSPSSSPSNASKHVSVSIPVALSRSLSILTVYCWASQNLQIEVLPKVQTA